jgi:hypothetical protein
MGQKSLHIGFQKGHLTVVSDRYILKNKINPKALIDCVCDCTKKITYRADKFLAVDYPSCGCQNPSNHKVGGTGRNSPEHNSWRGAIMRCHTKTNEHYPKYGGRGVRVCDRWRYSFGTFCDDMGPRPKGTSIDRINPWGDYEPGNCRWADDQTQSMNQRKRHPELAQVQLV